MRGDAGAPQAVRVRVPATSANLGPGYDTFGLALARYDEVTVAAAPEGLQVDVSGEGAGEVPRDRSHLVVSSMLTAFRRWHREPPGLRVECGNAIPHGRGLGSSAAAIVAGLLAARALLPADVAAGVAGPDLLALAAEIEGHPDNVAAALAGGLTLAWSDGGQVRSARLEPHADVLPVVCVPGWSMSTETARGLVPDVVPHGDAVFNVARSGLLVAALTQHPEWLLEATEDRLHQPYRAAALSATAELLDRLRGRGVPAVLSGAGPTVLALCDVRRHEAADVEAVAGPDWRVEAPGVDRAGAIVQPAVAGRE